MHSNISSLDYTTVKCDTNCVPPTDITMHVVSPCLNNGMNIDTKEGLDLLIQYTRCPILTL